LAFDGLTMTTKGINLQTKVQAGTTLNFTKIKVGDGVLSSGITLASLTDLVESKLEVEIESVTSLGDGTYRVRGTLTNANVTTGFFLREVGVFATDPDDGEILYSVANAGDECDYLPAGGGSVVVEQVVDIITAVGSASSVTATINEGSVLLSKATFTEHQEANPIDHPDNSVTDAKIGTRTIDDTVEAASGAGVLTNLFSKIGYMIKSITGESNWYTAPDTTLAKTASHISASSAAHAASAISNTASGNISSTTVQAALNELDTEKAALAGAAFTGAVTIATTLGVTGKVTLSGAATVGGTLGVTGKTTLSTLEVTGATALDSTLAVTGETTITGALAANGGITVNDYTVPYIVAESLGTTGYRKWSDGKIEQWGITGSITSSGSVTFPVTFSEVCTHVGWTPVRSAITGSGDSNGVLTSYSTSGFSFSSGIGVSATYLWVAEGY